ncbi:MAG: histidine phosphatase family protein [Planctomycetota bacterium]
MGADSGQAADARFGGATEGVMPESRVARVHLLRHAEVAGLERRVVRGQLEVGPGPRAEDQERRLTAWIASSEPGIDRVVSSDLERCQRLGRRLAEALGVELELAPALREQSMGRWEGQTWEEVTRQEPDLVRAYWEDYAHTRPPGGEALTDLSERVSGWWLDTRESLLDHRTAVVTHVGVMRVLIARLLGLPLDQSLRLAPAVASHTKLLWSEAGPVLEVFGERPWLMDSPASEAR